MKYLNMKYPSMLSAVFIPQPIVASKESKETKESKVDSKKESKETKKPKK